MRFAALTSVALLVAPTSAAAQLADLQPGRNFTAQSSFGLGNSVEIDPGDVDVDGDLDVVVANGGDGNPQLARIYTNDGIGAFVDETATRFGLFSVMRSNDVDFVDFENDGDLDLFFANHDPSISGPGQVSRFMANLGGQQQGTVGFFEDETDARWGTLAAVPAGEQVCGGCNSGPFRDWSCDCDFGDLDDDGDSDLFFGSYGPGINGTRDSRVFLNDGTGVFNELWPWADPAADTKTHTIDMDLADFDGDFDLDVFMSSRQSQARVYMNNLYAPLGHGSFRDITQTALIDTLAPQGGSNSYEVECGDVDADGDFDAFVLNYTNNFDAVLRNDGTSAGAFSFAPKYAWLTGDPLADEHEMDFGDYDDDGDLDAFVANFSGTNWLYQNSLAQGWDPGTQGLLHRTGQAGGQASSPELPSNFNGGTSLDGEWADLDGDGDLDILLANDGNQGNWLFRNILGSPDTHAPVFDQVSAQADKPNGSATVIHARVQDNAPFYLHDFYDAQLVYAVDDGSRQSASMLAQGGQQYRGVIPAQTDATIEYHVELTDLAGNSGISATFSFEQGEPDPWTDLGSGLAGVSGIPSLLGAGPLTAGSAGLLTLSNAAPSAICALFVSIASTPAPFKCGMLVPVPVAIQLTLVTNGAGGLPLGWGAWPSGLSGASLYFQYAIADVAAVCGTSLSNAIKGDAP